MYKNDILNLIKTINSKQKEITLAKTKFNNLLLEKENKKTRNYNRFKERFETIDNEEKRLKKLFDNKFFKFIKLYDFLDEQEIYESKNFEVNTEIGCLNMNPKTIITVNYSDKVYSIDKRNISYKFNNKQIINAMEYSFYSLETNLPLIPSRIILKYDNHIDNFSESYFRYFNNNNTNNFISSFIFEPKIIKEVIFYFDENVNFNNSYAKFKSIQYKNDNELKLFVENTHNLSSFNIYKKSNELFRKFNFSFSEDNEKFKDISFNNNESIISLENKDNFVLKITVPEEKIKQQDKIEIKTATIDFKSLEISPGVYNIPTDDISIESIKITFPISSSAKLKEKFTELSLSENDFFSAGAFLTLNKNYIKTITEISKDELESLKLYDDESILKTNSKAFDFYFDKENKTIYTSSFLSKYNFYLTYQYNEKQESISEDYYTPMLFDFSIKG